MAWYDCMLLCLGRLIEECWNENPASRPYFKEIIHRLTVIQADISSKKRWKVHLCFLFYNSTVVLVLLLEENMCRMISWIWLSMCIIVACWDSSRITRPDQHCTKPAECGTTVLNFFFIFFNFFLAQII